MSRSKVLGVIGAAALLLALALSPSPADANPRLGKKQAARLARKAVRFEFGHASRVQACRRRAKARVVCKARWTDDFLIHWRARVAIFRIAPPVSPVDFYRIRAVGRAKHLSKRVARRAGRITVKTRRAQLGQTLRLLGVSGTDIEVTPASQYIDPAIPESELEPLDPGTRFVTIGLRIENVGNDRFEDNIGDDARLVMSDGSTVDSAIFFPGCSGEIAMASGETRTDCAAFEVPLGLGIRQLEFTPDSGFSDETGVWR